MARARNRTKVKAMTAEAMEVRRDNAQRAAVNDIGAVIGLPEAQRGHHAVKMVPTAVDGAPRPIATTLRKLTRAERLHRSGAINDRQAAAIDLYADAAELAYGTCQRVANYGEGGGSSPTGAASAAHDRQLDRAYDADRYLRARAALPLPYVTAFERVVLANHPLGQVGHSLWPGYSKAYLSGAMREMVRTCADVLCIAFARELDTRDDLRTNLAATMLRLDAAARATTTTASSSSAMPVSDALDRALVQAQEGAVLLLAPQTLADLMREQGLKEGPAAWRNHPIEVVERWRFGWLVQSPA